MTVHIAPRLAGDGAAPVATVLGVEARVTGEIRPGLWHLEAGGLTFEARQAPGCLVRPAKDDLVIMARSSAGDRIVTIIDRAADMPLDITGADARKARLTFPALRIDAAEFAIHGRKALLVFLETKVLTNTAQVTLNSLDVSAATVRRRIGDLVETLRTSLRRVSVLDRNEAATRTDRVSGVLQVDTDTTLITGRRDVRIDGERINLG